MDGQPLSPRRVTKSNRWKACRIPVTERVVWMVFQANSFVVPSEVVTANTASAVAVKRVLSIERSKT